MIADMGMQDIIAIAFAAACVVYTVRRVWRTLHVRSGCGCGHSRCPAPPADDSLSLPVISDHTE